MKKIYDTPYYFWILAEDIHGQDSSLVAFTGSPIQVLKKEWLIHFTTPWKATGMVSQQYRNVTPNSQVSYTVPANKVALLQGYFLKNDNTHYSLIMITAAGQGQFLIDQTTSSTGVTKSPAITNGLYVKAGDSIDLIVAINSTGSPEARCRIKEFNEDTDITLLFGNISNTTSYVVPAGYRLLIIYCWATLDTNIQVKDGGNWYNIWDPYTEHWDTTKGVLEFAAGTEVGGDSVVNIHCIGILLKGA